MFSLNEIVKATGGRLAAGDGRRRVGGVSTDSRTIKKDELFVAIKGKNFDGGAFAAEAFRKGACGAVVPAGAALPRGAAIIEVRDTLRALGDIAKRHRERFAIPVVGVTGSNGKTTLKDMAAHILSKRMNVLKNDGTQNNLVGLPMTLLRINGRTEGVVCEMGANRFGEIARLADILRPAIGVITNIGPSHLEFFKDRRGVLKAKSELARRLGKEDLLILNGDDDMLARIRPASRVMRFGLSPVNDIRALDVEEAGDISFMLNGLYRVRAPVIGRHNVYNLLGAIAVCARLGMNMSKIAKALPDFRPPGMRMELKVIKGIRVINDAYNSNPLSLESAVRALCAIKTRGRRVVVSGDMLELGSESRSFHESAGRFIAASPIDALITVGGRSRETAAAARRAGMDKRALHLCAEASEAAALLGRILRAGDTVLVKGSRGMSMEKALAKLGG